MIVAIEEKELEPYIFILTANPKLKNLTAEQIYSISLEMASQVKRAQSNKRLRTSTVNVNVKIDTNSMQVQDVKKAVKAINEIFEQTNKEFSESTCL